MDKAIAAKDIKVGDNIVIHATEKDHQLIAVTVKIGTDQMNGMSGMKMDTSPTSQAPR
jgi:hypothetical protein